MRNALTIYRREISAYFNSPIAYVFTCLFVFLLGLLFFAVARFFSMPAPDISFYLEWLLPLVLAAFVPAITMRLWAEEKRTGTLEILMTLPLRSWEIVIGKYFAGMTVITVALLLTLTVPASVWLVASLDWGVLVSSYIGVFVVSSVFVAMGSWTSTWTQNQIVSLLVSVIVFQAACWATMPQVTEFFNQFVFGTGRFVTWFGVWPHYQEFAKGLVHPVGFIWGIGLTVFFLILTNMFVEGRKF